jgi:predicted lipid-binding transport protein (Tim44 family)
MKKILSAILTLGLIFSPIGSAVFQDQTTTVEAKSYKSGKRSFNNNNSNNNSFFQKKNTNDTKTNSTKSTNKTGGMFSGGLMRGLMVGGLAGLLFGSLFANMGMLGSILGFVINLFAIVILINVIRKIFTFFKNKKKEEANHWRS